MCVCVCVCVCIHTYPLYALHAVAQLHSKDILQTIMAYTGLDLLIGGGGLPGASALAGHDTGRRRRRRTAIAQLPVYLLGRTRHEIQELVNHSRTLRIKLLRH